MQKMYTFQLKYFMKHKIQNKQKKNEARTIKKKLCTYFYNIYIYISITTILVVYA